MKSIGIIPSRLGSSRLPNKPLLKIHGKSMIEHVYKRSEKCSELDNLIVATCDTEIYDEVKSFGGNAVMTSSKHERCTDRIAEAVKNLKYDIIINIQGDEALVNPLMIKNSIEAINLDSKYLTANNASKIFNKNEFLDPNNVKLLFNNKLEALYFSREPIPSLYKQNKFDNFYGYKQVCIISFTYEYLIKFNEYKQTELEKKESIDMLRCLENGDKVKIVETDFPNWSVDTEDDLRIVSNMMLKDELFEKY